MTKVTSPEIAKLAQAILRDPNRSKDEKSLAASALSQADEDKETTKRLETLASKAVNDKDTAPDVKRVAASVLSQSIKAR